MTQASGTGTSRRRTASVVAAVWLGVLGAAPAAASCLVKNETEFG